METWKKIDGYNGRYEVSSQGRVKNAQKNKILKIASETRYPQICLCANNKKRTFLIHRLVAKAFIENPQGFPEVNHKDCNAKNNNVDNLEWCDRLYNIRYADRTEKAARSCERKVICVETGVVYDSGTKAAVANDLLKSKISSVCHGKRQTTGGFHWRFAEHIDKKPKV